MEHNTKNTISEEGEGYTSFVTFYLYAISYFLYEISHIPRGMGSDVIFSYFSLCLISLTTVAYRREARGSGPPLHPRKLILQLIFFDRLKKWGGGADTPLPPVLIIVYITDLGILHVRLAVIRCFTML
jgi:hypothetical protein